MAGRPSLRIGAHGKITRTYLGGGVWMARCRYRDSDGVTRIIERRGQPDEHDKHGKLAEDALIEALASRRPPSGPDAISLDTLVMTLVGQHIDRLGEDGRAGRTLDTYRYDAGKLRKFIAVVRVGEATPLVGTVHVAITSEGWRLSRGEFRCGPATIRLEAAGDLGVVVAQLRGERRRRGRLPRDGSQEPADRGGPHGGVQRVGAGPGSAVLLRPADGDAGRVAVPDHPAE